MIRRMFPLFASRTEGFDHLGRFSDAEFQPFDLPIEARPLHHDPSEDAHEADPMAAEEEDCSTQYLASRVVRGEERDDTEDGRNQAESIA